MNKYVCNACNEVSLENELELNACPNCDSTNVQVIGEVEDVQVAEVAEVEPVTAEVTEPAAVIEETNVVQIPVVAEVRVSRHFNHVLCQELMGYVNQYDVPSLTRGNGRQLITEKEIELLNAFQSTGYNIKRTGEVLGCTHTNVWQRLYGQERSSAKGILGKLREYAQTAQEQPEAQVESEVQPEVQEAV